MGKQVEAQGNKVYGLLCEALDKKGWRYDKYPEDGVVTFGVSGEDIPMSFVVSADEDKQAVQFYSKLPFAFPEDKRLVGAHAVCRVNFDMPIGCFDYNINTGEMMFRLVSSYRDSLVTSDLYVEMIGVACMLLDEYNDKLLMAVKGYIKPEDMFPNE